MKFRFLVGDVRKHVIEYSFNQLRGELIIRLNQREVVRQVRRLNEPLQEKHLVHVDENGGVDVLIEKERRPLFGHRYRIFLNGRLYKTNAGLETEPNHEAKKPYFKKLCFQAFRRLASSRAQEIVFQHATTPARDLFRGSADAAPAV